MIIEKIGTGATVEDAFADAKALLNAPEDAELHQEIIEYPKKKLFSRVPAKIKVWYEVPDSPAVDAEVKKAAPAKAAAAAPAAPVEKKSAPAVKKTDAAAAPAKPAAPAAKPAAPVVAEAAPAEAESEKKEDAQAAEPAVETRVPFEIKDDDEAANLLKFIIAGMNIEEYELTGELIVETDEVVYNLSCGDADGALIGRRGETLDSIQYLLRLADNKRTADGKHNKISVNVGNYREKRNDNLRAIAAKSARNVLKYGRNAVLEPMNPYERRIVHTAVQSIDGVTSHSVGSDGNRKVVISLEEGVQPTCPRGGYNNRGKGGYNKGGYKKGYNNKGGRGKGGYQKREPYKPAVTREPRQDAAGSLYGKIEIPGKTEE